MFEPLGSVWAALIGAVVGSTMLLTPTAAEQATLCPVKDMGGVAMFPYWGRISAEHWVQLYHDHPFAELSKDYFSRYSRDPEAAPGPDEMMVTGDWRIVIADDADPLVARMAADLRTFLDQRMHIGIQVDTVSRDGLDAPMDRAIVLADGQDGASSPEAFSLHAEPKRVAVNGFDATGIRAAVVRMVNEMGLRQAPILQSGTQDYTPRQPVRVGRVPIFGPYRDVVFTGNNGVVMGYTNLYEVSPSDLIPELAAFRDEDLIATVRENVESAREYGLRTYLHINTRLFDEDAPIFEADPDIRGAELFFHLPNQHAVCSEHPRVRAYLEDSMEKLIAATGLDGVMLINGGEEFYHCFMRAVNGQTDSSAPQEAPQVHATGRTNCARCDAIGAEQAVANLVNILACGARRANPQAEVVAWPYSASFFWSADNAQTGFIERMDEGTALLTEPEKEEFVEKAGGIRKSLWDYSIDLIGPGDRAKTQLEVTRRAGVPLYFKSDHEHAYEASRLPYIPCPDRWWDRSEAMVASGAEGSWVFAYVYRPCFGSTGTEIAQWSWWDPAPDKEELLDLLASRIAGRKGGQHLRAAWRHVSDAIGRNPEIPPLYFSGPGHTGPEHPMLADKDAELPELFYTSRSRDSAPIFYEYPTGNVEVFAEIYSGMRDVLGKAVAEIDVADALVPERSRMVFDAEVAPARFLYHTVRTQANFYEAVPLRDRFHELKASLDESPEARQAAEAVLARWAAVLRDELENARAALDVAQEDPRLFQLEAFIRDTDTLRAKIDITRHEVESYLPGLAAKHGLAIPRDAERVL